MAFSRALSTETSSPISVRISTVETGPRLVLPGGIISGDRTRLHRDRMISRLFHLFHFWFLRLDPVLRTNWLDLETLDDLLKRRVLDRLFAFNALRPAFHVLSDLDNKIVMYGFLPGF